MNERFERKESPKGERNIAAVILIMIGALALLANFTQSSVLGLLILPALGLLFLWIGIYSHRFGLVIPGGILTGLGIGTFLGTQVFHFETEGEGGVVVLGLALGFAAIAVIGRLMSQRPGVYIWSLVPAFVLGLVSLSLLIGGAALNIITFLGMVWPVILLVIGVYLLLSPSRRTQ